MIRIESRENIRFSTKFVRIILYAALGSYCLQKFQSLIYALVKMVAIRHFLLYNFFFFVFSKYLFWPQDPKN